MDGLIAFWSHALAAALFVVADPVAAAARACASRRSGCCSPAFALTACWAWLSAHRARRSHLADLRRNRAQPRLGRPALQPVERAARASASTASGWSMRAVAAVLGLQLVADLLPSCSARSGRHRRHRHRDHPADHRRGRARWSSSTTSTARPRRPAAPAIRFAMLALASIWIYDLNLYTLAYLDPDAARGLFDWRGAVVALTAPLFALGAGQRGRLAIRLSRAATFQSLSLLAICGYFAVMTILATALRGTGWDWSRTLLVAVLAAMTVAAMVLLPSAQRAQLGQGQARQASVRAPLRLSHRMAALHRHRRPQRRRRAAARRAAGQGLRRHRRCARRAAAGRRRERRDRRRPRAGTGRARPFARRSRATAPLLARARSEAVILELDALRDGSAIAGGLGICRCPTGWPRTTTAWAGVPLIHNDRLVGLVLLAAPDYRRAARLGGFRPAAHRRPPGGELARRSPRPGGACQRAAVRRIQPPLRLHPPRHQEPGQPVVAGRPQCRAARRQSRVPRRHGRDAARARSAR